MKDFPVEAFLWIQGKTVKLVEQANADEGFRITFSDDSWVEVGFSNREGFIKSTYNQLPWSY